MVLADMEEDWHELFKAEGQDYKAAAGAVSRCGQFGVRRRAGRDGALLLSGRPEGLSRPELFSMTSNGATMPR